MKRLKGGGKMTGFLRFSVRGALAAIGMLIFLLPSPVAFSQGVIIYQKNGSAADGQLGRSVAGAGDLNGDGKPDFIAGAPFASQGRLLYAGSALVFSGASGALLYRKNGAAEDDRLGVSVDGAGDVDGDGKADFIVSAPDADPGGLNVAGSAYLFSGASGAQLHQVDGTFEDVLGWTVAGVGDVNGDGKSDFIVGAPLADPGGRSEAGSAYVYSGATGALLYRKDGASAGDEAGFSVAAAGDVNGDGKPDFIVGAPGIIGGGSGSIYVYSGADGTLLYQKNGSAPGDNFGFDVAGAGDANGDGKSDFIVGARFTSPGGQSEAGSAYVYSGATGALLFQKDGAAADDYFGWSVAGAGDANGDGKSDFIVGARFASPAGPLYAGTAYLYSGANGSLLFQKSGDTYAEEFGAAVGGVGDLNGDGRSEFIIGAPGASPGGLPYAGSLFVYSLACASAPGDMNGDGNLTAADLVLLLNCVFLGSGNCNLCFADVSCNGFLNAVDLVIELNAIFLGLPIDCNP